MAPLVPQAGRLASATNSTSRRRPRRGSLVSRSTRVLIDERRTAALTVGHAARLVGRANSPWPQQEHGEEHEVPGEDLVGRVDLVADRLGDTEHDPAGERAPQRPEPADDHGLEREDEPRRPVDRAEGRADAEEHPTDRDGPSAMAIATANMRRSSIPTIRAASRVVGRRAQRPAERVRSSHSWRPTSMATATPSVRSGNQPTAS